MTSFSYYPGCSVKGTAPQYEESLRAVFETLKLDLEELDDWNCCGATCYMSIDEKTACVLSARNLALAERTGKDMVAPCSACYLVLLKTQDYMKRYPPIRRRVTAALSSVGLSYKETVRVRHPLEVLIHAIGLEEIRNQVRRPLRPFKVAPYYGCQMVRPYETFDDRRYPRTLDDLFETLGAQVVDFSTKTFCCGGTLTGTLPPVGMRLNEILLLEAHKKGANCIATVCPLCQFNLEAYQRQILARRKDSLEPIPVLYFTQLLGLALGLPPRRLGLQRAIIPVDALVEALKSSGWATASAAHSEAMA